MWGGWLDEAEDGAVGGLEDDEVGVGWVGPVFDVGGAEGQEAVDFGLDGGAWVDPEVEVGAVGVVQVQAGGAGGRWWYEEVGVAGRGEVEGRSQRPLTRAGCKSSGVGGSVRKDRWCWVGR
ncbi:hypothetical protein GCM10010522_65980 [Kribbella solani]